MREDRMPAVVVQKTGRHGDWNRLEMDEVPTPMPHSGEVLVQVEACSVNRADLLQRRGLYPPPPGTSTILGLDFAGLVASTASQEGKWRPGDRVFGIVAGGGYGRYVVVRADHLVPIPERLSFVEATAAAEVFFTAFHNLFREGGLKAGETVLIHGGGSGVGTAAIQLVRSAGATAIVTAGSEEKIASCIELGASYAINYKTEDFARRVMDLTEGAGVDLVLDSIGASYLASHIGILKTCGRLIIIGLMGGHTAEITLAPLLIKRLRIIGSVLRTQSHAEKAALAADFRQRILPLLASGEVRPVIHRVFPIQAVEEAHDMLKEGEHFGKVVLTWGEP